MESAPELLEITRQYLAALEQIATGAALARCFSPDVVQEEFLSRLVPLRARRGLVRSSRAQGVTSSLSCCSP